MGQRVDHVGIAVSDLDGTLRMYKKVFGLEPLMIETFDEVKVKMAILQAGEIQIHFMTATEPGAGPIGQFLEENGEGFHHIGFEVDDIQKTITTFGELSIPLKDKVPMVMGGMRVAFNEPKYTQNILFELLDRLV